MGRSLAGIHRFTFGETQRALSCLWEQVPIGSWDARPSDESPLCHGREHFCLIQAVEPQLSKVRCEEPSPWWRWGWHKVCGVMVKSGACGAGLPHFTSWRSHLLDAS